LGLTIRRHYDNAPITEAVIDIRVDLRSDFPVETLLGIRDQIKAEYPTSQDVMVLKANIQFQSEGIVKSGQSKLGFSFRSLDGKQLLQARTNGFTFSRLHPYENWDSLRNEARKLWEVYRGVANPIRAIRVAVRYINRIDIPLPSAELRDYLRTFPEVSPELPQNISGYMMQLLIPMKEIGATLSLIEASVPAPGPDITSINLDIDLFKESTTDFDSEEKVWGFIEQLRAKKNEIFEKCITDRARDLFKPV